MQNSSIEWTDSTWNPLRGCSRVSEGCRFCYAERIAYRFSGPGKPYEGLGILKNGHASWTGKVELVEKHLLDPLKWGPVRELILGAEGSEGQRAKAPTRERPRRIFVNSMSDLFHENVPDEWIDCIFAVMALSPQHQFQVLTKRPERMLQYLRMVEGEKDIQRWINAAYDADPDLSPCAAGMMEDLDWLLPNVWLGVSVENQQAADERIPLLLQTPAAVRFLSCEPLLGPITFRPRCDSLADKIHAMEYGYASKPMDLIGIDWVIAGGESGPGARPMHPDWVRSLRDQCLPTGTAFFFKQWGEYTPYATSARILGTAIVGEGFNEYQLLRVGKKAAGALLDGREHRQFPGGTHA